jgi:hypothetical protein
MGDGNKTRIPTRFEEIGEEAAAIEYPAIEIDL